MRAELLKLLEICIVRGISDKNDHIKESKPSSPQTYTNPPHTEPRDTSCQNWPPHPRSISPIPAVTPPSYLPLRDRYCWSTTGSQKEVARAESFSSSHDCVTFCWQTQQTHFSHI